MTQSQIDLPIKLPVQLYAKLIRDASSLEENVNGDTLFNFCITAWHLSDWLISANQDQSPSHRLATINIMRTSTCMKVCRDICNSCKHFKLDYRPNVSRVELVPEYGPSFGSFAFGAMPFGGGVQKGTFLIEIQGSQIDIRKIKNEVMALFSKFDEEWNI